MSLRKLSMHMRRLNMSMRECSIRNAVERKWRSSEVRSRANRTNITTNLRNSIVRATAILHRVSESVLHTARDMSVAASSDSS